MLPGDVRISAFQICWATNSKKSVSVLFPVVQEITVQVSGMLMKSISIFLLFFPGLKRGWIKVIQSLDGEWTVQFQIAGLRMSEAQWEEKF